MGSVRFLTVDEVLEIQADQVHRYGGSLGLRDSGLLESALAQPEATFDGVYLCSDLHEMAAAYLYHLVMNHPFIDGNKRVGAVAARVFLSINDIQVTMGPDALYDLVIAIAEGRLDKPQIAAAFRENSRPADV